MRRKARYLAAACLVALGVASCTDEGIVGTRAAQVVGACGPGCPVDELCHPELEVCVACLESTDCAGEPGTVFCDSETNDCVPCADDDDDDCDVDERDGSSPDDDDDDDDDDDPSS